MNSSRSCFLPSVLTGLPPCRRWTLVRSCDAHGQRGWAGLKGGKTRRDLGVVSGNEHRARLGELAQKVECGVHLLEVGDHAERPVELELLVEVHGVRGEYDR